ncbi:MAG: 6-phosphogluconolactonase [Thiohalocapsa sp.]
MMLSGTEARILDDKSAVAEAATRLILKQAREAIAARGRFKILLAGGTTPTAAYRLLAAQEAAWKDWHIYHGDERCVAIGDSERNSLVADEAWLDHVAIPRDQVNTIPAELGAEAAAASYEPVIADALPFDLVLLGMGEDGHTASLFPGHAIPGETLVIPVHDAPKPPPDRVSLTPKALGSASLILFLITGSSKRGALRRWQRGDSLPIAQVAGAASSMVLIDRDAADA